MKTNRSAFTQTITFLLTIGVPVAGFVFTTINHAAVAAPLPATPPITSPVTPTPLPTGKPRRNSAPAFETRVLPIASVKKQYITTVSAFDKDGDIVKVTLSGLPSGLTVDCTSSGNASVCTIKGIPAQKGVYQITATATDTNGLSSLRTFHLIVTK
jgi:hypothetical protein